MSPDEMTAQARLMYGPRAFARELRRFTGEEHPGPDGWIVPAGEVWGYEVGYHRTGKRGAVLSTRKGFSERSFDEALAEAEAALTPAQRAQYEKRRV